MAKKQKTALDLPGEKLEFTVWGDPKGYVRMTSKSKWTDRSKAYHEWMREVQRIAVLSGLILPLEAGHDNEIMIRTWAIFDKKRHPDTGNVHKGVEDALFYLSKSGDKHVGGCYGYPLYAEKPRVRVLVERVRHRETD